MHSVAMIPGDGIGPEVMAATERVLAAAGAPLEWIECQAGLAALAQGHDVLPQETLDEIERHGVALKGPCTTPVGEGFTSVNVQLRKRLMLYAAVRPVRNPGRRTNPVRRRRPHHRAREHRGAVQRCREPGHRRRGHEHEGRDPDGVHAHRSLGLSLRHPPAAPQDHRLPQGQHHEDDGRALPALGAPGARSTSTRTSTIRR